MIAWVSFLVAFLLSLALIPLIRKVSLKYGLVSFPRKDRWHQKPMPMLGGVGISAAFIITLIFVGILVVKQGANNSNRFGFDLTTPTYQWIFSWILDRFYIRIV